jgi:predicted PurR-regulated permease PerM
MQSDNVLSRKLLSKDLMDVLIRLGLVAFLAVLCYRVFAPFIGLLLWALILAVALYPLHRRVANRLGGRQGRAATLIVLVGVLLIGVPSVMLASSFAEQIHDVHTAYQNKEFTIKQPDPSVAKWPLVGKRIYDFWSAAAQDLPGLLKQVEPQLVTSSKFLLGVAANTVGGVLSFLGSLIIAGIMMAYGESGSLAMRRIISRLAGPEKGPRLHGLSTATIRSVATGVIGVALIQALLLGVGFIWAGIPGAGVLAFVVLLIGIMQLPALIVSLPVIAYLWWSGDSTAMNLIFSVYLLLAGMADNVLKPLLLGRGVEAPMPVILLGALGGMVTGGMVGLFVGAVLLAVGYQIFMEWVAEGERAADEQAEDEAAQARVAGE